MQIVSISEVPSGSEPQKRKRAAPKSKRKTSVISNASADASHTTNGEEGDREPEIREPESAPASDVDCFIKMNDSGTVIEGGDIYQISGSEVCVGVKRVLMDSKAIGSLVVGNVVMDDVTVTTPINRLATTKHPVSRKDRQTLEAFSLLSRRDDLVTGSFEVRLSVRRALLGKLLLKEVKSGLRLASFKKTFSLGIVSPEFDFKIFDLNNKFKQEFSYAFGNLSDLDSLLGNYWDVQSPLGNCTFVTRVTLKVKDLHIVGKVSYARCRMTLPKHYRAFLSKYDISCEETEVADVDVDLA